MIKPLTDYERGQLEDLRDLVRDDRNLLRSETNRLVALAVREAVDQICNALHRARLSGRIAEFDEADVRAAAEVDNPPKLPPSPPVRWYVGLADERGRELSYPGYARQAANFVDGRNVDDIPFKSCPIDKAPYTVRYVLLFVAPYATVPVHTIELQHPFPFPCGCAGFEMVQGDIYYDSMLLRHTVDDEEEDGT